VRKVVHALCNVYAPGVFRCAGAAPDVRYDDGFRFRQEAEYAERCARDLPVKLLVGGREVLTLPGEGIRVACRSYGYRKVRVENRVIDGDVMGYEAETFLSAD
jgi:hypothetical protein